jgi:hypothetical protein
MPPKTILFPNFSECIVYHSGKTTRTVFNHKTHTYKSDILMVFGNFFIALVLLAVCMIYSEQTIKDKMAAINLPFLSSAII